MISGPVLDLEVKLLYTTVNMKPSCLEFFEKYVLKICKCAYMGILD